MLCANSTAQGELKFRVKWEGYDKKEDQTWEDEENLRFVDNLARRIPKHCPS